jgi:hypothetical protein
MSNGWGQWHMPFTLSSFTLILFSSETDIQSVQGAIFNIHRIPQGFCSSPHHPLAKQNTNEPKSEPGNPID